MNSEYYFEATDIIEIIFRNIRIKTTLCFLKKIFLLFSPEYIQFLFYQLLVELIISIVLLIFVQNNILFF